MGMWKVGKQDKVKIGVAIPCHLEDLSFLRKCLFGINQLNPKPYRIEIDVNKGERTLREIRERLFDKLFSEGCDVVLQCSSDFYLFPKILRYVQRERIVTFPCLTYRISDLPMMILTLLGRGWTGCYSLPKQDWFNKIKDKWDGTDRSIRNLIKKREYICIKKPCYRAMRPWRSSTLKVELPKMSFSKRFWFMFTRLKGAK